MMATETTVSYHADEYRVARPAINVKDYHSGMDFVAAVEKLIGGPASGLLGESQNAIYPADLRDEAYERIVSDFWQAAQEIATQRGLGEIEQEGRSGGWLVFTDGFDPEHYVDINAEDADVPEESPLGEWLANYRAMTEWADAWIADGPRKVAALAQQIAMDELGIGPARRWVAA
jgi:hypothetical protein